MATANQEALRRRMDPERRERCGQVPGGPIYASDDGAVAVDQYVDEPECVHVVVLSGGDAMAARLVLDDALDMAHAIHRRFHLPGERMSAVELSILLWTHAPREAGPCRVCGHDMTIASMGGGEATKYVCGSDAARFLGKDGEAYKAAQEHYRASEQLITYHGDPAVGAALVELRRLREYLGEDMTVPAGELFFPEGHGRWRCSRYLRHLGDDQWDRVYDPHYLHDLAHATLEPQDDDE